MRLTTSNNYLSFSTLSTMDIKDLTTQILSSRSISRLEQQIMSAMLYRDDLDEQDRTLIERVCYGVRHGILKIIE